LLAQDTQEINMQTPDARPALLHQCLLVIVGLVFLWSAIAPHDYFTWLLEVFPVLVGAVLVLRTYKSFRLTSLLYVLLAIHACILLVGGHYTYAEVPLFNWIRDGFDLSRNHYDRVGHFVQGFVPAILAREVLLRKTPLQRGGWLSYLVLSVCLAFSAFYELIEWWAAAATGEAAVAFLGTQGDIWDTQWDMFLALCGALVALTGLSGVHDRQINKLS
jgi:putative membrane protein